MARDFSSCRDGQHTQSSQGWEGQLSGYLRFAEKSSDLVLDQRSSEDCASARPRMRVLLQQLGDQAAHPRAVPGWVAGDRSVWLGIKPVRSEPWRARCRAEGQGPSHGVGSIVDTKRRQARFRVGRTRMTPPEDAFVTGLLSRGGRGTTRGSLSRTGHRMPVASSPVQSTLSGEIVSVLKKRNQSLPKPRLLDMTAPPRSQN